jgi:type II secretory pathway component GspD/PulD (secretin)
LEDRVTVLGFSFSIRSRCRRTVWPWAILVFSAAVAAAGGGSAGAEEDAGEAVGAAAGDVPRQVLVEMVIFEVQASKGSEIGTDLRYGRGLRGATELDPDHPSAVHEVGLRTLRFDGNDSVTFPTSATGPVVPGSIFFRRDETMLEWPRPMFGMTLEGDVIVGDRATIYGRMRALVDRGVADIVSRPVVVVGDGKKANIHVGAEVPYQKLVFKDKGSQLGVAFEKIGVDLGVTPTILDDGATVKLDLAPAKVSSRARSENLRGVELPTFTTREASTTVRVPNGQLVMIGGLFSKEARETVRRVPVLGRIPVLGFFFRSTETSTVTTELKFLIGATILEWGQEVPLPAEFTRVKRGRTILQEEY